MQTRDGFRLSLTVGALVCDMIVSPLQQACASPTELTARPPTTDIVNWGSSALLI
jgi:hypothetical protein